MDLGRFELCINVADLEASRRFYEQLGFEVVGGEAAQGWVVLKNSSLSLALYCGHLEANTLNFRGTDVFAVSKLLMERGVSFEKPPEIERDGSAGAWLKDPDGNVIYLNTAPGERNDGVTLC